MLVNSEQETTRHVKFVSYDGRYPCLCMGRLCLEIDGERVYFSDRMTRDEAGRGIRLDANGAFWTSGGSVDVYNNCATTGEWKVDVAMLPERYRAYAAEIDRVFNDNVDYGCCGGCM